VEPIKLVYSRATGLGLKSAARNALVKLGLTDADINRRDTISTILVLEPSVFFRKRMVEALKAAGSWEVREAGGRAEAENLLNEAPVGLLISECADAEGGIQGWFQSMWEKDLIKYVYLCTSTRDLAGLGEPPWLIGTLYKPFPMEKLIEDLKD
jgi:hypothetical protein